MTTSRAAFIAAPLLTGAYGVFRLVNGMGGERQPGFSWTAGHLCFLLALGCFVRAFAVMRARAGAGRLATVGYWLATVGATAVAGQFAIDLVVGWISPDRAAMALRYDQIQAVPGVMPVCYTVLPLLFFVGQTILVGQLARRRVLRPWAPVLVLVDNLLPFADKDLIPLGAVLLLISYAPLYRSEPTPELRFS
ncbi:hypothetical protein [Kitasatospora sp. MMS16-BH015]|uniref:hypothetical protein n=1 Tax=Kitasatospora sp. MMS16-BH015 TaxID=2018025 RepID=UPI000CF26D29|nr:hypothetical protein [Kitasatospora sp. MMS16-BH015]